MENNRQGLSWLALQSPRTRVPLRALSVCTLMLTLSACTSDQLPINASLTISPNERQITIIDRRDEQGRCFIDPSLYIDEPLVLALRDAQGSPIGNKSITVHVDHAENTSPLTTMLALYDDELGNGNGVIDNEAELISGSQDALAQVKTDPLSGDRVLFLRINLSCPFSGDVFAYVDGVTATASIAVRMVEQEPSS